MTNEQSDEPLYARVVSIKKEKSDPEVEQKIESIPRNIKLELLNINHSYSCSGEELNRDSSQDNHSSSHEDDKKNIEPVKSSNEILTELFKVFNAVPPNELLDDKSLIKKVKKHKKSKKKKHRKSKSDNDSNKANDKYELDVDSDQESKDKQKHKKKKKHKHKEKTVYKSKEKCKNSYNQSKITKIKNEPNDDDCTKHTKNSTCDKISESNTHVMSKFPIFKSLEKETKSHLTSRDSKRKHDKDSKELSKTKHKRLEIHSNIRDDLNKESSCHDNETSDITLSDEETYLKSKECVKNSNSIGHKKDRSYNSFYAGMEHTHTRDRTRSSHERHYNRSRNRDRDRSSRDYNRHRDRERERGNVYSRNSHHYERHARSHSRSRTRSRSRSRSRDLGIDKKRLLEIARKNAISMFKRGNLPGCDNMSQEIKDKVLLKMRYGGRTVEDLTQFCKKISKGEELSDLSSDEESDVDKGGNVKAFHHPFQLKEREPIVMHIRNSKPIVPAIKNTEQTKAITMQFPVSSGELHRLTESWVPVENKTTVSAASQMSIPLKNLTPKNVLGKPLPVEKEQEPAFNPVPQVSAPPAPLIPSEIPLPNESNENLTDIAKVSQSPASSSILPSIVTTEVNAFSGSTFTPDVPIPSSSNDSVFPQPGDQQLDVSAIISKRLSAMRRLQENPMDSEALKMMYNSQKEMTCWASSKYLPGQFTGSTGATILKPSELNSGPQVWARKDQLTSSKPVTGGMGMQLLQKMGWKPGEGLGPEKKGVLQPLLLDVKLDKRGLVAQDDISTVVIRKPNILKKPKIASAPLNIQDKHPVCLLNELTSKRKWTPPMYNLIYENGASHSRMFLFSVEVNGQTFTPDRASNTKKEAKLLAAKHCLQQIGILPPD